MSHPFGDLLTQYRARKHGLSQARLAEAVGYDPALIGKMCKGGKELTGPSGRDRVVLIIQALRTFGVLSSLAEANALLAAADMPPLYEGLPVEAKLIQHLNRSGVGAYGPPVKRTNLPTQLTSFIGRENEMAELAERVKATRLLTLTGSGGVGKTRLALEVAGRLLDVFADGVWVVELAPLSDHALVPQVVASAFKLLEQPGRTHLDALVAYLEGRHVLLILDNCEHLIDACASLAEALLRHCPKLHVLATSRETLRIAGEITYRVPSLTAPEDVHISVEDLLRYESVRLFRERAIASQSAFEWSPSNAVAVSRICSQLDGIPLAIELAASRLNALSAGQIAERLTDRFNLLTCGSRTALARHQTLRAAIAWSYDLLTQPEQRLFDRLSVFAGGFTADAAEFMSDQPDALTLLSNLVDKSLVIAEVKGGAMRYRLLETIRQFAHENLVNAGELDAMHQRHMQFYVRLAEEAKSHFYTTEMQRWIDRMYVERDNIRAALDYAAQRDDASSYLSLIEGTLDAWFERGYVREGLQRIDSILLIGSDLTALQRAKVLSMSAWLLVQRSDIPEAIRRFREALAIARQLDDKLTIYQSALGIGRASANFEEASAGLEIATQVARSSLSGSALANVLLGQGVLARKHSDLDQAETWLKEGLRISLDLGHVAGACSGYHHLALVAYQRGDYTGACASHEACIALAQDNGIWLDAAAGLAELANASLRSGDHERAASSAAEAIETFRGIGNEERVAQCVLVFAGLARAKGQPERAVRLLAATAGVREQFALGAMAQTAFYVEHDHLLDHLRAELVEPVFTRAWAEGRAMTLAQAVEYALSESTAIPTRGRINHCRGDTANRCLG